MSGSAQQAKDEEATARALRGEWLSSIFRDFAARDEKVRENRLRRAADRQGLQVVKSRRRDPRAADYGKYMIVDPYSNAVVAGAGPVGPGMDLDEVEGYLLGEGSG